MAQSLNKVMLIGNLGKDAESRQTPSGTTVTNFSVATTARIKDSATGDWKDKTDWHDVVLWRGERVAQYLTKGKKVFVEGRLQTRSYEDRNGEKRYKTEVVCDSFGLMLLGDRGGSGEEGGGGYRQGGQSGGYGRSSSGAASGGGMGQPVPSSEPASSPEPPQDDDDIPF
ncbi:MAG: single-stranded DNA-binding protein [Bryobacterales bacterium]|nr:single-stranded DNA-binding protein [Bryobacterales bacterium]